MTERLARDLIDESDVRHCIHQVKQNMAEEELGKKVATEGTIDPKGHLEAMNQMIRYMAEKNKKPAEMKE